MSGEVGGLMRRGAVLSAVGALSLGLTTASAMAQGTISVNREKVLGTYGTVESANTPISPLAAGPGRVFTQNVGHSGATAVRFHFTVLKGVDLA